MNPLSAIVLVAAFAVPAGDASEIKGTLCFEKASDECKTMVGMELAVDPAETSRRYVWTDDEFKRIVIGELAAGEKALNLESRGMRSVTLSVRGDASRGWPAESKFILEQSKDATWSWKIPAARAGNLREISVPEGEYRLSIASPRHKTDRRKIRAQKDLRVGDVVLKPLPAVRGRVVAVKGEEGLVPLADVDVLRGDTDVESTTASDGRFSVELREPIPEELQIRRAGYALRLIELANLEAENDLGEIVLERGATFALRIIGPADGPPETLRVRLLKEPEMRYEMSQIAARELPADEDAIRFSDLSAGVHYVGLEGDGVLEKLAKKIDIREPETLEEIEIAPFRLEATAKLGDEPLRDAVVSLGSRLFEARIQFDGDGRFDGTTWQHGTLRGFLESKAIGGGLFVESPELGADPSEWNIAVPRRFIEGRVLDAESKQPVPGARMKLEISSMGERSYSSVPVESDGHFVVAAVRDGVYDLEVSDSGHIAVRRSFEFSGGGESMAVDFMLDRGIETTIEVFWANGTPVSGAGVIEGVARDGHKPERMTATDGAGRFVLRSLPGANRVLYVLPQEGSFAVIRLVAAESDASVPPLRVVVPPPTGSLRLRKCGIARTNRACYQSVRLSRSRPMPIGDRPGTDLRYLHSTSGTELRSVANGECEAPSPLLSPFSCAPGIRQRGSCWYSQCEADPNEEGR
ncbi:MAG: carboxypeptidase-like regulatory domain-containing protein [Thermoanaerobaculia bacterium]